jgi:hypothetical protein
MPPPVVLLYVRCAHASPHPRPLRFGAARAARCLRRRLCRGVRDVRDRLSCRRSRYRRVLDSAALFLVSGLSKRSCGGGARPCRTVSASRRQLLRNREAVYDREMRVRHCRGLGRCRRRAVALPSRRAAAGHGRLGRHRKGRGTVGSDARGAPGFSGRASESRRVPDGR